MSDTAIIPLAPVAVDCPRVIPEELAQEMFAGVEHDASTVYLYVHDRRGRLTPDTTDFQATTDHVMRHSNLIVQASTGGVSSISIAERRMPLACPGVEMTSLNIGSVNLGDTVYFNPGPGVEYCPR